MLGGLIVFFKGGFVVQDVFKMEAACLLVGATIVLIPVLSYCLIEFYFISIKVVVYSYAQH